MSAIDPNQVRDLFLAAADLPESARTDYLAGHCGGDVDLRAAVDRLLAAHAKPASILDPLTTHFVERPDDPGLTNFHEAVPDGAEKGTVLAGRYKLVEPVGEGGMGAVWLARQSEPVKRMVAVKLIKPGMDSRAVLARFEAERQALALMDHPNIARVLDGGATPDGRPFFVMDLVKGVPITQYCDGRRLTPRERLELFVPVCQAIQHAHQKGIIHRDIKPSNVLVALYDDRPVPKVIDFGVAKAMGNPLTEETFNTGFGAVVGTPQYMSPEQATFNNVDVDTRSDLYSLGVLLYELLVGSPPFARKDLEKAGMLEMLRVVREVEPPRPSTKLSTADGLPSLAANRSTEPKRLTGLLRNELDWIVMKALEKDRARRYDSANGFAADVLRYLAGEPVQAVPPSPGYRIRKLMRRHKGRVAAGTAVATALVAALVGSVYGAIEAEHQRTATTLREQAERDRDDAREAHRLAVAAEAAAKAARREAEDTRDKLAEQKTAIEQARDELAKQREKLAWTEYGRAMQVAYLDCEDNRFGPATALLDGALTGFRGWEWHYVHRLCHPEVLSLGGHSMALKTASFSPDGKHLLTTCHDGTVTVWDASTGTRRLSFKGQHDSASFSPDGTRVITANRKHAINIWDTLSGVEVLSFRGPTGEEEVVSFSPDATRLLTLGREGIARILNARTGAEVLTLRGPGSHVSFAAFSPDGTQVITAGREKARFKPDGTRVKIAGPDNFVRIWNARTGAEILAFKGDEYLVKSATFSPDGKQIVTAGGDSVARIWDVRTGTGVLALKGHTDSLNYASFSPDGTRVLTASEDQTARVWDSKTGAEMFILRGSPDSLYFASFSPDGSRVVTAGGDSEARVWDTRAAAVPVVLGPKNGSGSVNSAWFNPDCTRVVTAEGREARIWDARTGEVVLALKRDGYDVWHASFGPDGTQVVTAGGDKIARIWDARSGAQLQALVGHSARLNTSFFSPDGTRVVTASADGTARVWDVKTGTVLQTIPNHKREVNSASFSPDGTRVITTGNDTVANIYDARTGTLVLRLKGHTRSINLASYSPDGLNVITASADGTAREWDAKTGAEVFILRGHQSEVKSGWLSPDGTRVITAGIDGTVKVWDAKTGVETLSLKAHKHGVWSATFSPDGMRILTSGNDGAAKVWDARPVSREFLPKGAALPLKQSGQ